jgi:hypothetical protein
MHIVLDDDLVAELDERVGRRGRSAFIARAVARELEAERRWQLVQSAIGSIRDGGHEWDEDPAAWVARQRRADADRVG